MTADFNYFLLMPVIVLVSYGLLIMLMAPFFRGSSAVMGPVSLFGLGVAGWLSFRLWQTWRAHGAIETASGLVRVDGFGLIFTFIILLVGALAVLMSLRFLEREEADHPEFYALLLIALAGMVVMVNTTHLMMVLIGLETFSLALYILCGLTRRRVRSVESALKYFLLGAFSSGFLVYGLALLYGTVGSLDMREVGLVAETAPSPILWAGLGLVLVAFAFKVAAVPFHFWVPDVYQGAPTNVTGFMAAATKTAAFAALLRLLPGALGNSMEVWSPVIWWLAVLTLVIANLVALAQTNIKRLLAFSSIGHAGYLLIGLVATPDRGVGAITYYLAAYAFMTVGAFAVASAVGRGDAAHEEGYDLWSWAGLGRRRPALAAAMTVFLFSLAGMPPTAGFLGKYVIFKAAVESGQIRLAVVGVLAAVVAAYYYLRVIVTMWMQEPEEAIPPMQAPVTASMAVALSLAVLGTFLLGLEPDWLLELSRGLAALLI